MPTSPENPAVFQKNPQQALQMLSLCRRAGKLKLGFDVVKASVMRGEAELVLCSRHVSEKTEKEVRRFCREWGAALYQIPYTLEELEYYVGKRVGILAVIDKNFGRTICAKLPDGQQLAAIDCTSR